MRVAVVEIVIEPFVHGLENKLLRRDVDVVRRQKCEHVVHADLDKLLPLNDFLEVVLNILHGSLSECSAAVGLSKRGDPETVGGMQLAVEEGTAGRDDLRELQNGGRFEKRLHIILTDANLASVGKTDNVLHCLLLQVSKRDIVLLALQHVVGEHGTEVWAAC